MTEREKEVYTKIINILKDQLNPKRIILFGSRAKGTSEYYSDFDFAVDCEDVDRNLKSKVNNAIEAIAGLYSVDVVYMNSVKETFKEIIEEAGKVVYEQ